MESNRHSTTGVYRQLLGSSWSALGESVRRLHGEGEIVRAAGTFRVCHGNNRLARVLARLGGLPAAGDAVAIHLHITPNGIAEKWHRTFAGKSLVSWQRPGRNGLLVEEMGPLEIRFRLEVCEGSLQYHTASVALRLGLWRVPLPRWCIASMSGREQPLDDPRQTAIDVEVSLPLLGMLISYDGVVTRIDSQDQKQP
jgi:hypothetical protein